jgi:hypothetical protein
VESGDLSVTTDSVLVREKELAVADVDGRAVVLSLTAGSYFDFNRFATEIWDMLAALPRRRDIQAPVGPSCC